MRKFDVANADRLDSAERLAWNNPAQIVAASSIPPGARVAEIGCGTGWFTFELERAARPRGMVFALDTQPAMLQILRARRENWERILTLPCGENTFELDDGEVDCIFHANVLHECEDAGLHLKEVHRVLKVGGTANIIEWLWADEESQPGPPNSERIEPEEAENLLRTAGFQVTAAEEIAPYHYLVKGIKI